jgi:hypothetical protein
MFLSRFRRVLHRWLLTYYMLINHHVNNSNLQRLTHQQKVSYRTSIVSISCFLCLPLPDMFILARSVSFLFSFLPQGILFFSVYLPNPSSRYFTVILSIFILISSQFVSLFDLLVKIQKLFFIDFFVYALNTHTFFC